MTSGVVFGIPVLILVLVIILAVCIIMMNKRIRDINNRDIEMFETLISVMEAGNPNMDGHSLHVHFILEVFCDYLPPEYQRKVNYEYFRFASLFHDIGKLGIPKDIIERSGKLEKKDMDLVRRHPEIGVEIIKSVKSLDRVHDWIRYHHERVDGKGYFGLKGEEIPLESRIIAIADTYSALTMDRTYKASLPYEEAITELRQVAGTQLDRKLVEAFCEIPKHRLDECVQSVHRSMNWFNVTMAAANKD